MEACARRRLALLSSHIRATRLPESAQSQFVSASGCVSSEPRENQEEPDCVFCKIIRGQAPALKIYEDDVCLCILDVNPLSQGESDCLWASESLRRRKLKLDQEAARLAHSIKERLQSLDDFEDTKNQGSSSVIGT